MRRPRFFSTAAAMTIIGNGAVIAADLPYAAQMPFNAEVETAEIVE